MKIAIIGAGAMGSLFGGYLSGSGEDIILYDIYKDHVEAIRKNGLIIEEGDSGRETVWRPEASSDPNSVKDSDIIIVFVKSTATRGVIQQFAPLLPDRSIVITLQNGYGNEGIIRETCGAERTAAGVTSQGATFLGPGKIRHAGNGPTHLSMSNMDNRKLEPFTALLEKSGFETHISDKIENLIWSKLIINVGINALTAVTGLKNGGLLDFEETKALMTNLVDEALAVVKLKGIQLQYDNPVETVFNVAEKTGLNRSSMLQDFDRKRLTEIDFINGAIVKEAKKLGVSVPVNEAITCLVKTMEHIYQEKAQ